MNSNLLQYFEENGYIVVDDLIEKSLFERLLIASDKVVDMARAGEWDQVRVVGQMFPPWKKEALDDVWGVQHLMHYKLNEKVFAEFYGSDSLLNFVKSLLNCTEDQLQLELFNLLIKPIKTTYEIAWHRDAIPLETPDELEAELLKINHFGCQWNTALYEDDCLIVIPGSHHRPRTAEERKMIDENLNCVLPDQLVVNLKPGQTVFYNNNILHRGVYPLDTEKKRRTLHACIGLTIGGAKRADNILQHGLEWMKNEEEMKKSLIPRLIPMYERLLCLAQNEEKRKIALKNIQDNLKWGIVGTGNVAKKFIQALIESKESKSHVVAIASSSNLEKAKDLKNQFSTLKDICYCYGSYAELCADKNVDIVYIATPHSFHCRDTIQALTFGKNVLVEKPFAINQNEASKMISLASEKDLFLMEALWTRFMPVSSIVLDLLGKIGKIHLIQADLCINFHETDVNSRVLSPQLGGGALLDLGIYPISWVSYLISNISDKPHIPKVISNVTKNKLTQVDETSSILLSYDSLRIQAIVNTSFAYDRDNDVKIYGDNGSIVIKGELYSPKHIVLTVGDVVSTIDAPFEGNGYIHEVDHVVECLKKGLKKSPLMTLTESLLIIQIIDEIRFNHGIIYPGE